MNSRQTTSRREVPLPVSAVRSPRSSLSLPYAASSLGGGISTRSSSQASLVHQACSRPHSGHFTCERTSGRLAKVWAPSISMPVEIGRSVCGHLISKTAMGPSLLTSFAKVTSQSAIWRVERLVAIMERSSVRSVTFRRRCTQELQGSVVSRRRQNGSPETGALREIQPQAS